MSVYPTNFSLTNFSTAADEWDNGGRLNGERAWRPIGVGRVRSEEEDYFVGFGKKIFVAR